MKLANRINITIHDGVIILSLYLINGRRTTLNFVHFIDLKIYNGIIIIIFIITALIKQKSLTRDVRNT
jgi:hypothetical protein